MTTLLVIREYIKNFYVKYEEYILPVLKLILSMTVLFTINGQLGYMGKLKNITVILVVSLICSFMPINMILIFSVIFIMLHLYALSLECALVAAVVFLVLFLLYFRFSPRDTVLVIVTPLLFVLKIPYVAPVAAGLLGTPFSAITVACGVIVYYMISYMNVNAAGLGVVEMDSLLQQIKDMMNGILGNKSMLIVITAFAVTVILIYLLRRLSVDYAWSIAIVAGTLADIVILLVGDLMYDANFSIGSVILGSVVSVLVAFVIQFFRFNLDYSRVEKVQFEDDEYYYYVKAVPKMAVATPEKKVKKITTQRGNSGKNVKHTRSREFERN